MWLVPHFLGLDVAGMATQLFQTRKVASIYQRQSNAVFDDAMRSAAACASAGEIFSRSEKALPLVRAIKRGAVFFNLPDMDFGAAMRPSCPSSACRRPHCWRRRAWPPA
jgi:KDO2-lipid IV(A) lauroyltransferase